MFQLSSDPAGQKGRRNRRQNVRVTDPLIEVSIHQRAAATRLVYDDDGLGHNFLTFERLLYDPRRSIERRPCAGRHDIFDGLRRLPGGLRRTRAESVYAVRARQNVRGTH